MNTFQKSKKGVALFVLIMFLCTLTPVSVKCYTKVVTVVANKI